MNEEEEGRIDEEINNRIKKANQICRCKYTTVYFFLLKVFRASS
jgi:hypothetical protein